MGGIPHRHDRIKDDFAAVFALDHQRAKRASTSGASTTNHLIVGDSQTPRVAAVATFAACFAALNTGFQRAVGPLSHIACEMQPH